MKTEIRHPFEYDANMASLLSSITFVEPSMTQQHFKDESDINNIVNRFLQTGTLPDANPGAMYGDFLHAPDSYQEALNLVIEANEGFAALPSHIRARFQNDPGQLLEFLQDDKNLGEAVALGLVNQPVETVKTAPEVSPSSEGEGTS